MGIKQFLGVKWINNTPKLVFYDHNVNRIDYNECSGNINLSKTSQRRCRGYYDLESQKIMPCECFAELTDTSYSQCKECQAKSGFDLCLGCNGDYCRNTNKKAKEFCRQEHHVYLAYFANDKFKVGTAASYRRNERLLEQGALFSLFIAKTPSGQLARQIENQVSQLGITTRVNTSYKMNNLIIDRDASEIERMLIREYDIITKQINRDSRQYLISPIFNNFSNISNKIKKELVEESMQLDLFGGVCQPEHKEYRIITKPEFVRGNIKAVVGSLLLLENQNGFSVVNMKNLEGWLLDSKCI